METTIKPKEEAVQQVGYRLLAEVGKYNNDTNKLSFKKGKQPDGIKDLNYVRIDVKSGKANLVEIVDSTKLNGEKIVGLTGSTLKEGIKNGAEKEISWENFSEAVKQEVNTEQSQNKKEEDGLLKSMAKAQIDTNVIIDEEGENVNIDFDKKLGEAIQGMVKGKKVPNSESELRVEDQEKFILGQGDKVRSEAKLRPQHIIGKQSREILENGQMVVVMDIDKKKLLQAQPDQKGYMKISLYRKDSKEIDQFSKVILKIPRAQIRAMKEDENGRVKLLVAEANPNNKISEKRPLKKPMLVMKDNEANRSMLIRKNPIIKSKYGVVGGLDIKTDEVTGEKSNAKIDAASEEKELLLKKPLVNQFSGEEVGINFGRIREHLDEDGKKKIDSLNTIQLKEVINNPKNNEEYSKYREKIHENTLEFIKNNKEETYRIDPTSIPGNENNEKVNKTNERFVDVRFEREDKGSFIFVDKNKSEYSLSSMDIKNSAVAIFKEQDDKIVEKTIKELAQKMDIGTELKVTEGNQQKTENNSISNEVLKIGVSKNYDFKSFYDRMGQEGKESFNKLDVDAQKLIINKEKAKLAKVQDVWLEKFGEKATTPGQKVKIELEDKTVINATYSEKNENNKHIFLKETGEKITYEDRKLKGVSLSDNEIPELRKTAVDQVLKNSKFEEKVKTFEERNTILKSSVDQQYSFKDIINSSSDNDRSKFAKMDNAELKSFYENNKEKMAEAFNNNEKVKLDGITIKKPDQKTIAKNELKSAIVSNDENKVEKIIKENKGVVDENHKKLIKSMEQKKDGVSPKISNLIKEKAPKIQNNSSKGMGLK